VYEGFAAQGLPYGRTFRLLRAGRASGDGRSVVATLGLEEVRGLAGSYVVPPPLIDALLHSVAVSGAANSNATETETAPSKAKVPFSFDRVWMRPSAAARLWESEACTAHVEVRSVSEDMVVLDCSLLSSGGGGVGGEGGEVVLHMEGVHCRSIEASGVRQGPSVGPAVQLSCRWEETGSASVSELAGGALRVRRCVVIGEVGACAATAEALRSRIDDAQATLVITADGQNRRGAAMALKPAVDEAVADTPSVKHVLVVKRTGTDVAWDDQRDVWWHDIVDRQSDIHTPQAFDSEHPLFILYTSGTTGKPKGILHTSGGYLTQTSFTHRNVFDLKPDTDIFWCTADIGWVTGHSYIVYGPLANRVTQVIYEGTPDTPGRDRFWDIIERHRVTILYTAPTAIRTFMKWGDDLPKSHDLSSLRLLGSVGEPINPEAWIWYRDVIGGDRCPIVDTWWQTETGAMMISPLPGITICKPGSAMGALPGIGIAVVNDDGVPVPNGHGGYLVLTEPWPAMLRGIWGDNDRYVETYWSRWPQYYFAGDGAKLDEDGAIWLLGRVDDVMNVSGHRISTTEVESALVEHAAVAEAARELFLLLQVPLFNTPVVAVVVQPTIQEPQVLSAPLWAALAEVMAGFRITHLLTEMLRPL
jgi:acyl-coenzyme A synthetase/AMP-(fatty) acid ligase